MSIDLEKDNLVSVLDEGVTELIEILEDSDIYSLKNKNLLLIKEHLDTIYDIIEDGV